MYQTSVGIYQTSVAKYQGITPLSPTSAVANYQTAFGLGRTELWGR